jgi:hypothetical protein
LLRHLYLSKLDRCSNRQTILASTAIRAGKEWREKKGVEDKTQRRREGRRLKRSGG